MYLPKKSCLNFISPRSFKCSLSCRFPDCKFVCISPITLRASHPSLCLHLSHHFLCISAITLFASLPSIFMHLTHHFVCISPITLYASHPSLCMHLSHQWFTHRSSYRLCLCHPNNIRQNLQILEHALGEKFKLYNYRVYIFFHLVAVFVLVSDIIHSTSFVDAVSVPPTR